jgi:hypothetical protein
VKSRTADRRWWRLRLEKTGTVNGAQSRTVSAIDEPDTSVESVPNRSPARIDAY